MTNGTVLLAEIPPGFWAAGTALMMALVAIVQEVLRSMREKQAAAKVARQVAEVKTALVETDKKTDAKLDAMADTGERTHTLVNSNMGVQLTLNKAVTRRLANLTKDPSDEEAAKLAAQFLAEHERKQATVDAKDAKADRDAKEVPPQVEVTNLPPIQRVEIVEPDE